jgi:hypothetical protein
MTARREPTLSEESVNFRADGPMPAGDEEAQLEVELVSSSNGCIARFSGDLVEQTRAVLYGVESILMNDSRVVLDLSGIVSFDGAGLEAALNLMDAVRGFGGVLAVGGEHRPGASPEGLRRCDRVLPYPFAGTGMGFDPRS